MTLLEEPDFGTPARPGQATVEVTVDGVAVTVPPGTSVMRAAAQAGCAVPKLCATDSLEAFGSCRLCVVEIDGARGTPPPARRPSRPAWSCAPGRRSWRSCAAGSWSSTSPTIRSTA
ncbi:2Fe-2S iron-sulfur cluster-binding protein [Pseudonocardia benzenivorans]